MYTRLVRVSLMLDYEKLPSRSFFFLFLMVQVSYQLMMSDLNPLQSILPPSPPTAVYSFASFQKKKNDGDVLEQSNPRPGNSRVQLSRGELYYQPVRLCYMPSECIDGKATSLPDRAIILTFASVIYYWHGRSAIDCGTRHPCHPDTFNPVNFYFVRRQRRTVVHKSGGADCWIIRPKGSRQQHFQ